MKHNLKITAIILAMFVVTQIIGIVVVYQYSPLTIVGDQMHDRAPPALPYGLDPPEVETKSEYAQTFTMIVISFIIAITLIFFLSRLNVDFFIKAWFFVVVIIALAITFNAFFPDIMYKGLITFGVSAVLAWQKIYGKDMVIHNITELLIYPGIAAVFVPILNIYTAILLLIVISFYDIWAVWHSGIMQKMAKYQMDKLNIFGGFFIPYLNKKDRKLVNNIRKTAENKEDANKTLQKKKVQINVAILGGGDVIFPIIAAGVALKTPGLGLYASIAVAIGATLGLIYLFAKSEKKKFYPAMPFITAGIFIALILSYLVF